MFTRMTLSVLDIYDPATLFNFIQHLRKIDSRQAVYQIIVIS